MDGEPLVVRLRSSVDRLSGSWPRQAADRFVPRWGSSKERERAGRGGQRLADSEDDPLDGDEGVVVDDEACFVDGWQGKVGESRLALGYTSCKRAILMSIYRLSVLLSARDLALHPPPPRFQLTPHLLGRLPSVALPGVRQRPLARPVSSREAVEDPRAHCRRDGPRTGTEELGGGAAAFEPESCGQEAGQHAQ